MKRLLLLLLPTVAAVGFISCNKDQISETPMITIDGELTAKELSSNTQEFTLKVLANGEYTVSITPATAKLWLEEVKEPSTRALSSSEIKFKAKANTNLEAREAIVTLTRDNFSQKYRIVQAAPSNEITVDIASEDFKAMATMDEHGVWTIGILGDSAKSISNRGEKAIPLYVGPTGAFRAWVDEGTPWLTVDSSPGNQNVNIRVQTTYNDISDPSDYSEKRVGVVHFESSDKQSSTHVVFIQAPRVAGEYVLETPEAGDPAPTDAASSQLGKQLLGELPGFRSGITTLKISGPMTEFDFQALAFTGDWATNPEKLNNVVPTVSVLDLSGATFETIPANVMQTESFTPNTTLRQIILPEGLKTISAKAFQYCQALEEVNIPSTVEEIGDNAFVNGTAGRLSAPIIIPRSVKKIGVSAFENNRFTGITFEEPNEQYCTDGSSRLVIGDKAFAGNTSGSYVASTRGGALTEDLIIPEWVSSIGFQAFAGLYYQTPDSPATGNPTRQTNATAATIKIGGNVEFIGYGAFSANVGVTEFEFVASDKPLTISQSGSVGVQYGLLAKSSITEFTWPIEEREIKIGNLVSNENGVVVTEASEEDGVVSLPGSIFAQCVYLKKVTVKYGITRIGDGAFFGANVTTSSFSGRVKLDELTLPTSLVEFGTSAFNMCYGVGVLNIVDETGIVTAGAPGVWDLRNTKLATIGASAFNNYAQSPAAGETVGQDMTEIRFPSTIIVFQNSAMSYCAGLGGKPLYLPDGFTHDAGENGRPTIGSTNGDYVIGGSISSFGNIELNYPFQGITPAPIYTYVPLADWDTIDYEE